MPIYYDDPSDILLVRVFQNIIVNVIYLTNHMTVDLVMPLISLMFYKPLSVVKQHRLYYR